jgi:hypothetical protein
LKGAIEGGLKFYFATGGFRLLIDEMTTFAETNTSSGRTDFKKMTKSKITAQLEKSDGYFFTKRPFLALVPPLLVQAYR